MPLNIDVSNPSTIYVHFLTPMPKLFVLYDSSNEVFYFRYLSGQVPRIKFNVPIPGVYHTDNDLYVSKVVPIEIPDNLPSLPPAQRDRLKDVFFTYDETLQYTASIDTISGNIIHGPKWKSLIKPLQIFIDEHEKGHFFYEDEEKCDLYALVNFVRMGYNESMAYFCLANVIKRSAEQMQRVRELFSKINSFAPDFQPGF